MSELLFSNFFIPSNYNLHIDIDENKSNYSGSVSINLEKNNFFNGDLEDSLSITLNTLSVISLKSFVEIDGVKFLLSSKLDKGNQTTTYSSNQLKFSDVKSNQLVLIIQFLATVDTILTYKDQTKGVFKTKYMDPISGKTERILISTHTQPYYARKIFPCLDNINSKCEIELELSVNNNFTCISNMPIESNSTKNSKKTVKFKKSPPMSLSVFAFSIGDFEFIQRNVEMPISKINLPLRIYTALGNSNRAQIALNYLHQYITILEKKFNIPFPLEKLDIVSIPFLSDGAVENWGIIKVINDGILMPDWDQSISSLSAFENRIKEIVAHQLVHMYLGALVTFDSWDHEWMNESFANFMAYDLINELSDGNYWIEKINGEFQNLKLNQMSSDSSSIFKIVEKFDSVYDTYSTDSFQKGIYVLRMLASLFTEDSYLGTDNYNQFFKICGEFVNLYKFKCFKPIDLWNFIKLHPFNKNKYDIPTIMNSWIRTPGYPIIKITKEIDDNNENIFKLEQHRCLDDINENVEDIPYQIPLFIKQLDGKIGRQLMTDRTLTLKLPNDNFYFVNSNSTVMSIISYPFECYQSIASNFNNLNSIEQIQFFSDLGLILNTQYQSEAHILASFDTLKKIKKILKPNNLAIQMAIINLDQVYKSITRLNTDNLNLKIKLNQTINDLINKFISQLDWDIDYTGLTLDEIKLRADILGLKNDNSSLQTVGKKLFRRLIYGPRCSIPVEFLIPILAIIANSATLKEYKELMKLIKTPNFVINNTFTKSTINGHANTVSIQLAAINSIGCVTTEELLAKTFAFVSSSTDKLVGELALANVESAALLWKWFKSRQNIWWEKWMNNPNDPSGIIFENVFKLVIKCCIIEGGNIAVEVTNLVNEKSNNNHAIKEWLLEAQFNLNSMKRINEFNKELESYL
ncbi:Tma108 protein [Martiniozyma asiatica (nom. inval.)]|nr:Tma108 protein [Martiniozyma asiatica]